MSKMGKMGKMGFSHQRLILRSRNAWNPPGVLCTFPCPQLPSPIKAQPSLLKWVKWVKMGISHQRLKLEVLELEVMCCEISEGYLKRVVDRQSRHKSITSRAKYPKHADTCSRPAIDSKSMTSPGIEPGYTRCEFSALTTELT